MTIGSHFSEYDDAATSRCERALVTLLGDVGSPWRERIVLVGGLVPRYLIGALPPDVPPHVGTTDIDLALSLVVPEGADEAYRTLESNLKKSGFTKGDASFRWARAIDGVTVVIEFLCEVQSEGQGGRIHKPHRRRATWARCRFAAALSSNATAWSAASKRNASMAEGRRSRCVSAA